MWDWLKDVENQRVLTMLGAAIAFLWTAGWGVYVYRNPRAAQPVPAGPSSAARPKLKIGPAVISWIVGLVCLAVVQYGWKLYTEANAPKTATYYLCMGTYSQNCSPTEWVPCHTNMQAYVKAKHPDVCVYIKPTKLSDVSGNECGYATYKYDCSTKEVK
jgi:hypothetical protein